MMNKKQLIQAQPMIQQNHNIKQELNLLQIHQSNQVSMVLQLQKVKISSKMEFGDVQLKKVFA